MTQQAAPGAEPAPQHDVPGGDATPPEPGAPGVAPAAQPAVSVTVTRTGGVAGLRRRWHVEPAAEATSRWIALLDRCPWDTAEAEDALGADRFCWRIQASTPDAERTAELSETAVTGPWRTLIDEVRAANGR